MSGPTARKAGLRREVALASALLAAIVAHLLLYPLTGIGGAGPLVFYLFYGSIFVFGTWSTTSDRGTRLLSVITGLAVFASGILNSYSPSPAFALAVYASSIAYHAVMVVALVHYIFTARQVMTEILVAATSLYLVLGSMCAALFALIEWLVPGSYVSSSGATIDWQLLLYYSYVTLTTVGYGDVTPIGFYAQSFAAFEAIAGVLYTVILLARLVGLHASRPG